MEATLVYKLQAAHEALSACLRRRQIWSTVLTLVAKVIVLDSDALVTSRACFDEWTAHREDVIAQVGGAPGCPS